jgi:hypothetical protein
MINFIIINLYLQILIPIGFLKLHFFCSQIIKISIHSCLKLGNRIILSDCSRRSKITFRDPLIKMANEEDVTCMLHNSINSRLLIFGSN